MQGGQRDWKVSRPEGSRHPGTRPIKGLDQGIRLNKALWDLAATYVAI